MRIYVASSWRNEYQPAVVNALREAGHTVYDFKSSGTGWSKDDEGGGGFGWSSIDPKWKDWTVDQYLHALQTPQAGQGFERDMRALCQSDACVMVMPCGLSAGMEFGLACGQGKYTVVYVPGMRDPDLMVKMADIVTCQLDHTILALAVYEATRGRSNNVMRERIASVWH